MTVTSGQIVQKYTQNLIRKSKISLLQLAENENLLLVACSQLGNKFFGRT